MLLLYTSMVETPAEESKIERLYKNYRQTMYYVAFQILKDSYEAEDAVHNAFLRVIANMEKIDERNCHKTKGFLVAIVEHTAIDIYRKRKRASAIPFDELSLYTPDTSESPGTNDVLEAINRLPILYATILRLKYSHGYQDAEISKLLNISEDNVRQRVSRGKKRLQQLLKKEGLEL